MSDKEGTVKQFDTYMKTAIRNCVFKLRAKSRKIEDHELPVADISIFDKPIFEEFDFLENKVEVLDFSIAIKNDLLYEALSALEQHQRDVIYLSACECLSDLKIADLLRISRSKVQRIKSNTKEKLKKALLGEMENDR